MRNVAMVLLGLLLWSWPVEAACPKIGTTYTCAAGSTESEIAAAISAASAGNTVHINAGMYSFGTNGLVITNATGIIVEGAGVGNTIITGAGFGLNGADGIRITGFEFQTTNTSSVNINGAVAGTLVEGTQNFRLDHNYFNHQGYWSEPLACRWIIGGPSPTFKQSYGVFDHNTLTNCRTLVWGGYDGVGANGGSYYWSYGVARGTPFNVFFEDESPTITPGTWGATISMTCDDQGRVLCNYIDAKNGASYVARFNALHNTYMEAHPASGLNARGARNSEIYENTYDLSATFRGGFSRMFSNQGSGTGVYFHNVSSNNYSSNVYSYNYVLRGSSACNGTSNLDGNIVSGWPCMDGIGIGASTSVWTTGANPGQTRAPFYSWENSQPSTAEMGWGDYTGGSLATEFKENRDFFLKAASFNGTTGMGVGLFASRPSSCTPDPTGDQATAGVTAGNFIGVGYWATDRGGNWNTANGTANDGALYVCVATDTWSSDPYYTPYTYPHPLQGGADVTPPAVPTGVYVTKRTVQETSP